MLTKNKHIRGEKKIFSCDESIEAYSGTVCGTVHELTDPTSISYFSCFVLALFANQHVYEIGDLFEFENARDGNENMVLIMITQHKNGATMLHFCESGWTTGSSEFFRINIVDFHTKSCRKVRNVIVESSDEFDGADMKRILESLMNYISCFHYIELQTMKWPRWKRISHTSKGKVSDQCKVDVELWEAKYLALVKSSTVEYNCQGDKLRHAQNEIGLLSAKVKRYRALEEKVENGVTWKEKCMKAKALTNAVEKENTGLKRKAEKLSLSVSNLQDAKDSTTQELKKFKDNVKILGTEAGKAAKAAKKASAGII